jgi:hypothetical protein
MPCHKDNKLLPTQVMPDQARAEKHWWYDPRLVDIALTSPFRKDDSRVTVDISLRQ